MYTNIYDLKNIIMYVKYYIKYYIIKNICNVQLYTKTCVHLKYLGFMKSSSFSSFPH